jgi:hypothetical protein
MISPQLSSTSFRIGWTLHESCLMAHDGVVDLTLKKGCRRLKASKQPQVRDCFRYRGLCNERLTAAAPFYSRQEFQTSCETLRFAYRHAIHCQANENWSTQRGPLEKCVSTFDHDHSSSCSTSVCCRMTQKYHNWCRQVVVNCRRHQLIGTHH